MKKVSGKIPSINIVSATFNAEKFLPRLIESIRNQTDKNFKWIIADGGSTDDTLKILNRTKDLDISISIQSDFGIYDALNRAIKKSNADYYIVMGADDQFDKDALFNFRKQAYESQADIIAAAVIVGNRIWYPKKKLGWIYGMGGVASSHSVGLLIRKNLHDKFGYYVKNLSITADQLFIKNALLKGASINRNNFIAGELNMTGFSSNSLINFLTEFFVVQIKTEKFKFFQVLIFFLRIIKNFKKL